MHALEGQIRPGHSQAALEGQTLLFCEPDETVLTTPQSSLSQFVEGLLDAGTPIVDTNDRPIIPPGDEDGQCVYFHDGVDPPQVMYTRLSNGSLCVQDVFGAVKEAKGMALGMLLRTVGGKRVAGMPLELVEQRIMDAEKPVELVFVDNLDESSEGESDEAFDAER